MITDFNSIVTIAIKTSKKLEYECDIPLKISIDDETIELQAYAVSISPKGILFYTNEYIVEYLVDKIGDEYIATLFDISE